MINILDTDIEFHKNLFSKFSTEKEKEFHTD